MNHVKLDQIEADVRSNTNSLAFGLAQAYALGKSEGELPPDPPSACGCNCCGGCARNGLVADLKGKLAYIRRDLEAIDVRTFEKLPLELKYLIGRMREAATREPSRPMGAPCSPSNHYDPAGNEPDIGSRDDG